MKNILINIYTFHLIYILTILIFGSVSWAWILVISMIVHLIREQYESETD